MIKKVYHFIALANGSPLQTKFFDFDLPPGLVALRPAMPRDSARLLVVYPDGRLEHRHFRDLGAYLENNDILSFNDSRVIPARLSASRPARGDGPPVAIEVTLHRRTAPDGYLAFLKPAKRVKTNDRLDFPGGLSASVEVRGGGEVLLGFTCAGAVLDAAIAQIGTMPLPPYIAKRRAPDAQDQADYQTVYAREKGSVAAPTAGLHFTAPMMAALAAQGVAMAPITLHVGAGTFLPVSANDTDAHVMHAEYALLTPQIAARLNAAHDAGGRICAVGTTSLRTLESASDDAGLIQPFDSETAIFITPGYRFRAVDMLVTNFHLPKSTLFMLVSAFMGLDVMQAVYAEAIRREYKFYSYGDACLLIRPR